MNYITVKDQIHIYKPKKYLKSNGKSKRFKCPNCSHGKTTHNNLRSIVFTTNGKKEKIGFYCDSCLNIYLIDKFKFSKVFQADITLNKTARI